VTLSFEIRSVVSDSPAWIRRRGAIAPILPWKIHHA